MGLSSRDPGKVPYRRGAAVAVGASILVAVLALLGGLPHPLMTRPASMDPAGGESSPTGLAEASLESGGGPALGDRASCALGHSGAIGCDLAPSPAASANAKAWSNITSAVGTNSPANRYTGMMAYDPVDRYVVLYGGDNNSRTTSLSDTWTYSDAVWTELPVAQGPPARCMAGFTWDAADGYLLLYGGLEGNAYPAASTYNDTWVFLHGVWTEKFPALSPGPRFGVAMAYDFHDGYVVLFGGTYGFAPVLRHVDVRGRGLGEHHRERVGRPTGLGRRRDGLGRGGRLPGPIRRSLDVDLRQSDLDDALALPESEPPGLRGTRLRLRDRGGLTVRRGQHRALHGSGGCRHLGVLGRQLDRAHVGRDSPVCPRVCDDGLRSGGQLYRLVRGG